MKYCLIGEKLGHSYSKTIHEYKGLSYDLTELTPENLPKFFANNEYNGFNVTIPYKKEVIKYLNSVDDIAQKAGAVNAVVKDSNGYKGYNTDVGGMAYMISSCGVSLSGKTVMILGTGGTSNTAKTLCEISGAKKAYTVSRTGEINYQNCYELTDTEVIINTTPVGMHPNVENSPINLSKFTNLIGVFDCVYNPYQTELIMQAKSLNIKCSTGLAMLVEQALLAEDVWLNKTHSNIETQAVIKRVKTQTINVVLCGMAGCGKSSSAKKLSEITGKEVFDSDVEITNLYGKTPAEIITTEGEQKFREIESEVIKNLAKKSGVIIALGGGGILNPNNVRALKRNGVITYIEREVELLSVKDRPLSQINGVKKLYSQRKPIYECVADITVKNNSTIENLAKEILNAYENSCN